MVYNAFVGGIQPGGLTNDFEVKILICFLMEQLGEPMGFGQMNEIVQQTGLVNYFEFAESISELEKSGHLSRNQGEGTEPVFSLTQVGVATAKTFTKSLPLTVREKTQECIKEALHQRKKREEVQVEYHAVPDGYLLSMVVKDVGSDLMSLQMFLPSEEECAAIRERIYTDPAGLYQSVLALLRGEELE